MILYKGYYPTFGGILGKRGHSGKKQGEIQNKSIFGSPPAFSRNLPVFQVYPETNGSSRPPNRIISEAIEERYQRAGCLGKMLMSLRRN